MDFSTYVSPVDTAVRFVGLQRRLLGGGGPAAFSPADLSNLVVWLDASDSSTLYSDAGKTIPAAIDGDIAIWADKSGNGYDVSQNSTGKYPLRKASAVRWDGTDDYLQHTLTSLGTQPYTVYIVAALDSGIAADTSQRRLLDGGLTVAQKDANWAMTSGAWVQGGTTDSNNNLWRCVFNDDNSLLEINGVTVVSGDAGGSGITTNLTIGARSDGARNFQGDISMVVIQGGISTAQELAGMKTYVNETFGVSVS